MLLFFDTETTGKADFKAPLIHPSQPHLVQLDAILTDDAFNVRGAANLIVKPEGYTIPKEASDIHGITQEIADKFGVDRETVLSVFSQLAKQATVFVAHNFSFDHLIMSTLSYRVTNARGRFSHLADGAFCTMQAMTPICKLPGNYGNFKWPKLQEAYKHAFGKEFEGAHDAMADVRACLELYKWLKIKNNL